MTYVMCELAIFTLTAMCGSLTLRGICNHPRSMRPAPCPTDPLAFRLAPCAQACCAAFWLLPLS